MIDYDEFLDQKRLTVPESGFDADLSDYPFLFDWQADVVKWALYRGKSAIFADCGLGKTPMQLVFSDMVQKHTNKPVLILAPLAVADQTAREGKKFGIHVNICETQSDIINGVNVTNYEKLHHFSPDGLGGIILDESSILKAFGGKTRKGLTAFAKNIHFRLCCTATPSPNDLIELTNHSEFLDIMTGSEIIALYFTQDGNTTHKWRLKGHARKEFWKWMAQWSVAIRKPSDLGYDDNGFVLPPLNIHDIVVDGATPEGYLLPVRARTLQERRKARKASLPERVKRAAKLANNSNDQWLVWCDLNAESEALKKAIPDAVEIKGSDKPEKKKQAFIDFSNGDIRILVTKPSIAGFGMNWQQCHNAIFTGLSDSYEQFYQAVRRNWRFGQENEVNVYVITSSTEGEVVKNIKRKEQIANDLFDNVIANMNLFSSLNKKSRKLEMKYETDVAHGDDWTLYLGDSIETIKNVKDASIDFSIFSPPFPGMYTYTNSTHDIGNTTTITEMIEHMRYLADELLRVLVPGRLVAIHLMQMVSFKSRDGFMGVKDFRGATIKMMQEEGFHYHGEVTIDKNPQIQATRNKDRGLLFKSLATDSSVMRMALADYLILFRKPGDNPKPIRAGISARYDNPDGWITEQEWIRWAHPIWPASEMVLEESGEEYDVMDLLPPVWYRTVATPNSGAVRIANPWGIKETDVLNVRQARETDDERHLCPLQLGVIQRAVKLWSAPGETVYSPFAGIGSEGYESLKLGRKFIGGELKRSYWETAKQNLKRATNDVPQMRLL